MWIKTSRQKPKDGQNVLCCIRSWSLCTDEKNKPFWIDHGVTVLQSFYTKDVFPAERGHFIDGFAFDDGSYPGTMHRRPKVTHWMPIQVPPYNSTENVDVYEDLPGHVKQ